VSRATATLPVSAYQVSDTPTLSAPAHVVPPQPTIDGALEAELTVAETTGAPDAPVEVVIRFAETHTLPVFPSLLESE
jgi:hypothetical protein